WGGSWFPTGPTHPPPLAVSGISRSSRWNKLPGLHLVEHAAHRLGRGTSGGWQEPRRHGLAGRRGPLGFLRKFLQRQSVLKPTRHLRIQFTQRSFFLRKSVAPFTPLHVVHSPSFHFGSGLEDFFTLLVQSIEKLSDIAIEKEAGFVDLDIECANNCWIYCCFQIM